MSNNTITPVGFDPGNSQTKITIVHDGKAKSASIPSRIAREKPLGPLSAKTGMRLKPQTFSLRFEDQTLWFGLDVLGSKGMQKGDMSKYTPGHLTLLFAAVLYKWGRKHKVNLTDLGKLNVVSSIPPGLFQDPVTNKAAVAAYRKTFNRGQSREQSRIHIRDDKTHARIATQFGGMQREAIEWGAAIPRKGTCMLVVDIGGGTVDYAVFNGEPDPEFSKTDQTGLLHAFSEIDSDNIAGVELKVLRNRKSLPHQLVTHYNEIERRVQLITLKWPRPIAKIYVIGGGAALMTKNIKATFEALAPSVIFKNEYANSEANCKKAGE